MNAFTPNLHLRIRALGSNLPDHLKSDWAQTINAEIERIDRAVGMVCTHSQMAAIKAELKSDKEGIFL